MASYCLKLLDKHIPKTGDFLLPDQWYIGELLQDGIDYVDDSFKGSQFVINSGKYIDVRYTINLVITGSPHYVKPGSAHDNWYYKSRVKIEFVHDGEVNQFSGGWLYHD